MDAEPAETSLTQKQRLYESQAFHLLTLNSVEDIEQFLAATPGLDADLLSRTFDEIARRLKDAGRAAEADLAGFVGDTVKAFIRRTDSRPSLPDDISDFETLLQAGAAQPNLLSVLRKIQEHQHLITAPAVEAAQGPVLQEIEKARRRPSPAAPRLLLCLVLTSKLLGNPRHIARAEMFWAALCRDRGRYGNARRHFARAEQTGRAVNDPTLHLGILLGGASLDEQLGDNAGAAAGYLKVLNMVRDSSSHGHVTPNVELKLAGCYRGMNRFADALELIDRALLSAPSLLPFGNAANHELRCRILRGLLLEDVGRYDEGLLEYEQAAKIASECGDRHRQFIALTNAATSHLKMGNHRDGLRSFTKLLETVHGWGDIALIASTHNNMGNALLQLNRPADARTHFGQALSFKINTPDKAGEAIAFLGLAECAKKMGDPQGADTFLTVCLMPLFESGNLQMIVQYASHALGEGRDGGEDIVSLIEAGQRAAVKSGETVYDLLLSRSLGEWHAWHDRTEKALEIFRGAIARGGRTDPNSLVVRHLQISLANLLSRKAETRQEAYDILDGLVGRIESQVREVFFDRRRSEVIDQWIRLFGALIRLLVTHGSELQLSNGAADPLKVAFDLHESAKSRGFISGLAAASLAIPAAVPVELREEETRLLQLDREYQADQANPKMEFETARLRRLLEIGAALNSCWEKMEPYAPEYVKLRRGDTARLEEAREILQPKTPALPQAFVSCFSDEEGTVWFVQRSDRARVEAFRSNIGRAYLADVNARLRRAFNGAPTEFPPYPPVRRTAPEARDLSFFETLSDQLLTFLPALSGIEHICIAPHGPLHLLPIHALRAPDGRYLAEHFAVTYAPNLGSLRYCFARAGAEVARADEISVYCAGVASREDASPELFENDHEIFAATDWKQVSAHSGVEASRANVLQHLASHSLVQLTCHGFFDESDPLKSGLLFSDGHRRPPRNPCSVSILDRGQFILSSRDILRTAMNARLVTLRACSTGLQAERNEGDEFDGLGRAILHAGNAATLVSLWNVDQESSQRFLASFYRHWSNRKAPMEKWRALWIAQKEFISASEPFLHHPYHWAPLVLIGDWR